MEKDLGWAHKKLGGVKSQVISTAGQTVLASLMESQICHLPASSVVLLGEGSEKGQLSLPNFLCGRKCPLTSVLMPDTSVPPFMPLVPFQLLLWCWSSEGVSLSKFMCEFFKGNYLGLQKFLLPTQFPLVFTARSYRNLPSWHWNLGLARGPGMGLGLLVPGISLLIFIHPMWVRNQPILCLFLSYQSGWMWFFKNSIIVRLHELDFCWFRVMVVLHFSCNFDVVVGGGELCLPMPPPWLEICKPLLFNQ